MIHAIGKKAGYVEVESEVRRGEDNFDCTDLLTKGLNKTSSLSR